MTGKDYTQTPDSATTTVTNGEQPGAALTFRVSVFNNKTDKWPKHEDWSWEDLVRRVRSPEIRADKDGALFSGASYHDGKTRGGKGVDVVSLLPLDYDHDADFDRDLEVWRSLGLTFASHTTHSSYRETETNPKAEERFRVIIPLDPPIPAAKYLQLWLWAQATTGGRLDNAPKNAASIFYAPAIADEEAQYKREIHTGRPLDWRELDLEEPKIKEQPQTAPAANKSATNGHHNGKWLVTPWDDYNSRPDAREKSWALLEEAGYISMLKDGQGELIARPGVSDHWGARLFDSGWLRMFSSAAPRFKAGERYSPFDIRSELKHDGDFWGTAEALAAEGYGKLKEADTAPEQTEEAEPADASYDTITQAEEIDTVFDDQEMRADHGNVARFLNAFREVTRYIYLRKKFLCFDGRRWSEDQGIVEDRVNRIVQGLRNVKAKTLDEQKEAFKHYVNSQKPERRNAILTLARAEIRIEFEEFDADPDLFNVSNGTIHLPSGDLRPHNPRDYCSKISKVKFDKDAKCERWLKFLNEIFNEDKELIAFIQRAVGYSLSGHTWAQVFFLLYGVGKNGKTKFLNVISRLVGEYATHAQMDVFTAHNRGGNGHNEDLARLRGARLVTAIESEESKRLSESLIKQITGNDPVTASYKHEHGFTFTPVLKLWLAANHKPIIRGTDDGIWRRPLMIPFLTQFEVTEDESKLPKGTKKADEQIEQKLLEELPGILNWAIEGFKNWKTGGLKPPASVVAATKAYRKESDLLGSFVEEQLIQEERAGVKGEGATPIYKRYRKWCELNGEYVITQTAFGSRMVERGFKKEKDGKYVVYLNLFLVPPGPEFSDSSDSSDSSSHKTSHESKTI
jgi:P4 family phage/plasmid primase-like protien